MAKQQIKNRLSIVERMYYQNFIDRESPVDYGGKFELDLEANEQPYQRNLMATEEWVKLDFGWLEGKAGTVRIENKSSQHTLQVAYLAKGEVPVADQLAMNEVKPLSSIRTCLAANIDLYIKSTGESRFSLIAFPA